MGIFDKLFGNSKNNEVAPKQTQEIKKEEVLTPTNSREEKLQAISRVGKKYHITAEGPKICTASIRECKYGKHFDNITDASIYYDKWQETRMKYPVLQDEKILEPDNDLVCNLSDFKDKSWISNYDRCTPDSFAVVVNNNMDRFIRDKMEDVLISAFEQTNNWRRRETSTFSYFREGLVKEKDKDALFLSNEEMLANMQNYYKMTAVMSVSPSAEQMNLQGDIMEIFKYIESRNPSTLDMIQMLNYTVEDYQLDDTTRVRVFRHKKREDVE